MGFRRGAHVLPAHALNHEICIPESPVWVIIGNTNDHSLDGKY